MFYITEMFLNLLGKLLFLPSGSSTLQKHYISLFVALACESVILINSVGGDFLFISLYLLRGRGEKRYRQNKKKPQYTILLG